MEDKEYNKCKKELKKYLNKNRMGKLIHKDFQEGFLGHIFREGYNLGKHDALGKESIA